MYWFAVISLSLIFSNKEHRTRRLPVSSMPAACTSAQYKLYECFYFPLLPNCSSGSKEVAISQLSGSPLKSQELGGGYYFSDDMEHILWPKCMAPRAINGLLICKSHFHWPPVRPRPFDLWAWLGTSESHYFLFLGGSCSFFPLCLPSEPGRKVFWDLREPI